MSEYISKWDFKDKHIDSTIGKDNFVSSARSIIYAAPIDGSKPFKRIGVVQGWNWGEQRQVEQVPEIGSDVFYLIPGRTMGQLSMSRILLFGKDLVNVIYDVGEGEETAEKRWIKSIKEISKPINMMFASFDATSQETVYSRIFGRCWITSRSENIGAGQVLIAESVSIMYEDILDLDIKVSR